MYLLPVKIIHKLGRLRSINTSVRKTFNRKQIVIPLISGLGYDNLSISETWMYELLNILLPLKKGTFIDIGVNVGQTLIKLRSVNPDIEWVGFEPNPKCVFYTLELIKVNHFQNCRLLPVGIFDREDILELEFYSKIDSDPSASVIRNFRPDQKVYERIFIPVCSFEKANSLLDLKQIAIIKIDVEGAELEVLNSLQITIREQRPLLMIEILPCYSVENEQRIMRQEKIEKLLFGFNYKFFRVSIPDGTNFEKLEPIDRIGFNDDLKRCEYVMVPEELVGLI
jgi:FkbM family methyltransferase